MANFSASQTGNGQFNAVFGEIVFGLQGKAGEDGKDFVILGYYDSVSELESAVKSPKPGDAYGVGLAAPYDIYIWDATKNIWKNNGPIGAENKIDKVKDAIDGNIPVLTKDGQIKNSDKNFELLAFKFLEGQEYKTNWLYGDKPVYTKLVSFGNIPNASMATVQHGIQNMRDVVFVSGSTSDRKNIPTMNYGGGSSFDDSIDIIVNNSVISIAAQRNRSSATAKIAIAYTKTTD